VRNLDSHIKGKNKLRMVPS